MTHEDLLRIALEKIAYQRETIERQNETIAHQSRAIVEMRLREQARKRRKAQRELKDGLVMGKVG